MTAPFIKPVFNVPLPPVGRIRVPVCSKSVWDTLIISLSGNDDMLRMAAKLLFANIPDDMPAASLREFTEGYISGIEEYCKENADIFMIPEKPDFEHDEVPLKLPIMTFGESVVKEHTGFDFDRISELDILDYRMLLADACKLRMLRRADGKGREYLNECYDFMHGVSDIFE